MIIRQPYEPGIPTEVLFRAGPDDLVSTPKPSLSVDHVRALVRSQSQMPRRRVILDLTRAGVRAQNALLKFLEEPPGDPDVILYHELSWEPIATVVSRCSVNQRPLLLTVEDKKRIVGPGTPKGFDWDRPLADLQADLSPERGVVTELLRALEARDTVAAVLATKGFNQGSARLLVRVIRTHLMGNTEPALSRASSSTLEQWCRLLETLRSPGLSVRWGVLTLLGR